MEGTSASRNSANADLHLPTRVYLVRHGQTALNASGLLRGRLDPPLDNVGRLQAASIADRLGGEQITRIVASPLRRALDTAIPLGAVCAVPVQVDDRLVDRDYGTWAGRRPEELVSKWRSVDAAPGVEDREAVRARAVAALADLVRDASGGTAVAVSHDVVIRLLLAACDPRVGDAQGLPQGTGHFNTMELRSGAWRVLGIDLDPSEAPMGRNRW